MARHINLSSGNLACLVLLLLAAALDSSSADQTKTVEFNVKPGGMVHSFSEKLGRYECSFTYASQGGTNEQWLMSLGLSDEDTLFSCSLWRPQGKSYLFFTQFKAELKGGVNQIKYAQAYSQTAAGGQGNVALKDEEFSVKGLTVTHNEGKFHAELSKLTVIGWTRTFEL
ncbi:myeloid-derived growth factor [Osmerus mordax]|uniref:myeloid-derived growth factor n=1 Tax=Osmerus mordax TaxID=8014 RepID=UPI0035101B80